MMECEKKSLTLKEAVEMLDQYTIKRDDPIYVTGSKCILYICEQYWDGWLHVYAYNLAVDMHKTVPIRTVGLLEDICSRHHKDIFENICINRLYQSNNSNIAIVTATSLRDAYDKFWELEHCFRLKDLSNKEDEL
jgi:hypothetical protein